MTENMWDQRYAGQDYAYGTEPNQFLEQNAGSLPVGDTICLGEGEGRNAVYLAGLGHRVTALDGSSVGLQKAQRLARQQKVEIQTQHADLADFVFQPAQWDAIVSIFCHTPEVIRKQVHGQIYTALRPGGVFILEAYTPEQLGYGTGGPPVKEMMMDLVTLKQELTGLDIVHGVELVREVYEGEFHHGRGAVVQIIAQKS